MNDEFNINQTLAIELNYNRLNQSSLLTLSRISTPIGERDLLQLVERGVLVRKTQQL